MSKRKVRFFVSYARANGSLSTRFLDKVLDQLHASKTYEYLLWTDNDVLVGEDWHLEVQQALDTCDLGIALISPAFLGSRYIDEHELPRFVGSGADKPLIPVMLQPVDFDRHDLKGLQESQIFRLDSPRFRAPKAFGECSSSHRERFAQALFRHIELRLDKLFGHQK